MNPFRRQTSAVQERSVIQTRWFAPLVSFCVVLLILAGLVEFYQRLEGYAKTEVRKEFIGPVAGSGMEKIPLFAELKNKPGWLDKSIVDQIFAETQDFAARDQATYDRLSNPLDQGILRDIAENYTGTDADGVNRWTLRDNAWIKRITQVRRVIARDRKSQTIEIYAEYRKPVAWVIYQEKCYLIDGDFVRLPGEYPQADRRAMPGLMAVTGVALPEGLASVPEPSASWNTPDLAAGMQLVELLRRQAFVGQIDAIDMSNFRGRKNTHEPWVLLDTIWPVATAGGGSEQARPRVVQWGRTIGDEKFYDVSAASKIKALNELYLLHNRIDADRDYVDIHTEQIWIPRISVAAGDEDQQHAARG